VTNFLKNMTISMRIILLSAVPIIGIATLTGVNALSDSQVNRSLKQQADFNSARQLLGEAIDATRTIFLEANEYLLVGNQSTIDEFEEAGAKALKTFKLASGHKLDSEVARVVNEMQGEIISYLVLARELMGSRSKLGFSNMDGLLGELHKAERELAKLAEALPYEYISADILHYVASARGLIDADSAKTHMASDGDHDPVGGSEGTEAPATSNKILGAAATLDLAVEKISASVSTSAMAQADKKAVLASLKKHHAAFASWNKVNSGFFAGMAQQIEFGEHLEADIRPINEWVQAESAKIENTMGTIRNWAMRISMVAVGIVVSLILLIGYFVSRSIIRPVNAIKSAIEQVAAGQQNVVIPSQDQNDEIGEMARSAEIFRQAMLAKGKLEQQAAAERAQNARREMELESVFQEDLAAIIESTSAGDFSRRIDIDNKEGLSRKIGDGMNKLVGTVDGALKGIIDVISGLARGDLSRRVEGNYGGVFLQLKNDTNTMADKFRAIAKRLSGSTREVQGATREIASGVADLSARTEHQASSLEETSASMEELAQTVRQNAETAREVSALAAAARDSAVGGGQIASHAVVAMTRIEDSSRQISDIVGLIQDIAFQTNLLALNAAVEAARAGDAGKGFAVVANEVRALAHRAGQASKDIKTLIATSDNNVRDGVALVKKAGTSLGDIVSSVKKVAGLVSEIAAASTEQSSGIEQVSRAVSGMDQMTQQNAALVEETNAALQSAQNQVEELRKMVSFFQIGEVEEDVAPAPSPAPTQVEPPNQVRQQFQELARRMTTTRGNAAPAYALNDWKEF
jgi:methyl-accepting chemotaxis protein